MLSKKHAKYINLKRHGGETNINQLVYMNLLNLIKN